ncbi:MAG: phosphotransferase family protein [Kineosporiaceae bacterium]
MTTAAGPAGLDAAAVEAWLGEQVPLTGRPAWSLLAGGRSNLSYLLEVAVGSAAGDVQRYVLRRPPLGHVQATAHDMAREHRVQAALAGTGVPVPRMIGVCEDADVAGAPFYVMEFVPGAVVRTPGDAALLDAAGREAAAHSLVDTLAVLHDVDPAAAGLAGFGRPEGFPERQVRRWWRQFEGSRSREVPGVADLHGALAATVPGQGRATVVHGDYRLDNVVLGEHGEVRAVLDWEMATLGDPRADLGLLLAYWDGLGGGPGGVAPAPGLVPGPGSGFPAGSTLVQRYASRSGGDVDRLGWFTALGYFKIAVILEGIHRRHALGRTVGEGFEGIGALVAPLVAAGLRTMDEGI